MRSFLCIVLLAGLAVVLTARPAAADPAKPGDYQSTIEQIAPEVPGYKVEIIGGDSFLQVTADPGHEVVVYAPSSTGEGHAEPFLRIRSDGVVEQNLQSPYSYSIQSRYGTTPPPNLNPSGEPQWSQVGSGGAYAWHDHRIHWMSPDRKPGLKPGDVVQTWAVDMAVDGTPVTVSGQLVLADPISPLPWFVLAAASAGIVYLVGRHRRALVGAIAALATSGFALYVGYEYNQAVPARAGGSVLVVVLPLIATVAAIVGVVLHKRAAGVIATLLSVACLGGWAIQRIAVLLNPVLPTSISFNVDRGATALALGGAVGAAILAVSSGALVPKFAELVDDDE